MPELIDALPDLTVSQQRLIDQRRIGAAEVLPLGVFVKLRGFGQLGIGLGVGCESHPEFGVGSLEQGLWRYGQATWTKHLLSMTGHHVQLGSFGRATS